MTTSPEQFRGTEVKTGAVEHAAAERAAELAKNNERSSEQLNESDVAHSIEKARVEAQAEAISGKEHSAGELHQHSADNTPPIITSTDREQSYKHTLQNIQKEMTAPEKVFSKIIHNPTIERVSDAVGATIARPNAILTGSITAFITVAILYTLARHIGFSLQGSETIIFFILGWALGIAIDMLRNIFKRQ